MNLTINQKSKVEQVIERLRANGMVNDLSDEQNIEVTQQLNGGMEEFLIEQKVKEKESEQELAGIVLNA